MFIRRFICVASELRLPPISRFSCSCLSALLELPDAGDISAYTHHVHSLTGTYSLNANFKRLDREIGKNAARWSAITLRVIATE